MNEFKFPNSNPNPNANPNPNPIPNLRLQLEKLCRHYIYQYLMKEMSIFNSIPTVCTLIGISPVFFFVPLGIHHRGCRGFSRGM